MEKRNELINARKKKHFTQQEVANYLGVKQPRYCKIENGKENPTLDQSKLLIKLLKINLSILWYGLAKYNELKRGK